MQRKHHPPSVERSLGLRHLFLWVGCSSVYLWSSGLINFSWPEGGSVEALIVVMGIISAPGHGAEGAGAILVYRNLYRRRRLPRQPGHLMLLAGGLCILASIGLSALSSRSDEDSVDNGQRLMAAEAALLLLAAAAYGVLAKVPRRLPWKLIFAATAGFYVIAALGVGVTSWYHGPRWTYVFHVFLPILNLTLAIALLWVAIKGDRRYLARRDWLHWLGILAMVWNSFVYVAYAFALGMLQL